MSEVKNEGLEVVAHQFQDRDGSWCIFTSERHYEMTKVDGSWPIRDLCRHSEALAGYAVLRARIAELERNRDRLLEEREAITAGAEFWHDGKPPHPYGSEWFIARLKDGSKAVLIELPEEFSHDYKTADNTYYTADWIIRWAQFPDSDYLLYAAPVAKQVVMPEPRFYWADSEEGSFGSPEEWAQDYYDYNGEKPESVLLSCAASLPDREYDSFEFDGSGNCISCRLVGEDSARLNAADEEGGQKEAAGEIVSALQADHIEHVRAMVVPDGWQLELIGPDEVVKLSRKDGKWCGITNLSDSPRDGLLYPFLRAMLAAPLLREIANERD